MKIKIPHHNEIMNKLEYANIFDSLYRMNLGIVDFCGGEGNRVAISSDY